MIRTLRPTPAMGVALLALVLAVGGTSYAAVKLRPRASAHRSSRTRR